MSEFITIATGEAVEVDVDCLRICIRRRDVGSDGGLSFELYGREDESGEEWIRFDLFRRDPHYHVPASNPRPIKIEAATPADALDFALGLIRDRLGEMLREAGQPGAVGRWDGEDSASRMQPTIDALRDAAQRAPEPTETRQFEITPEVRRAAGLD